MTQTHRDTHVCAPTPTPITGSNKWCIYTHIFKVDYLRLDNLLGVCSGENEFSFPQPLITYSSLYRARAL